MNARSIKYLLPLLMFPAAWASFHSTGIAVWLPILYAFAFIPLLELVIPPSERNMSETEADAARDELFYDWLLYLVVPLQYIALFIFLQSMQEPGLAFSDRTGRIMVMGLLCGIFGINVGHELGHRVHKTEQLMARALLLTSQYLHFFIEHNRGHHKHVGTPHDPGTAPKGHSLYRFWLRSIFGVYRTAWRIAGKEQRKKGFGILRNEMLQYELLQLAFCLAIGLYFGWMVLGCFLIAAVIGILLLETVNYIEHYGLRRKAIAPGKYERTMPVHSWNSNHVIGRLMLFELSRHSDHHYLASRKYQLLRHHGQSPQLPTGYLGSMILALVPPLWFYIMDRKVDQLNG